MMKVVQQHIRDAIILLNMAVSPVIIILFVPVEVGIYALLNVSLEMVALVHHSRKVLVAIKALTS
jgi:hypothetical protein